MGKLSQGGRAVEAGGKVEEVIYTLLRASDYTYVQTRTFQELQSHRAGLFASRGCFAYKCSVPLLAECHRGKKRTAEVDFVVHTMSGEYVLLSIKSQHSNGSAEEKLEYEIRQLIASELPAAMMVYGPMRGRDGDRGWTPHVLEQIWERTKYDGRNRILLFRDLQKLTRWIQDDLPVGGRGRTSADIFSLYCSREP